ncbi:MAG TPA: hypothetical protein VM661_09150 [Candidatus Sulfotelmatobacter sp.]|jgi:hypothetical protein|nr:hypothetical protein [Candidatus Sulfotelmatobacter sp.]
MFGFKSKDDSEEAKQAAIAAAKKPVRETLSAMAMAQPDEAERLSQRLKDYLSADKTLPMEYKQKARERARLLECNANMRAADKVLHRAVQLAAEEHMGERSKALGEARRYFSKASTLGADQEWRKAFVRLSDTVLMTGGVHHAGPSRAKPAPIAPPTPNRAKL